MTECYSGGCDERAKVQVAGDDTSYDLYLKLCPTHAAELINLLRPEADDD